MKYRTLILRTVSTLTGEILSHREIDVDGICRDYDPKRKTCTSYRFTADSFIVEMKKKTGITDTHNLLLTRISSHLDGAGNTIIETSSFDDRENEIDRKVKKISKALQTASTP